MEALTHGLELPQEELVNRVVGVGIDAADDTHITLTRVPRFVPHVERWLQPGPENLLEGHRTIASRGFEASQGL